MRVLACSALLGSGGCGARTDLLGEGGGEGDGGAGGGAPVACGAVVVQPAISIDTGDELVGDPRITTLRGDPDQVAMVGTFASSGTLATKLVTVDAWSPTWPSSLGPPSAAEAPSARSVAVSEGRDFGYALLEVDVFDPPAAGWFAYRMPLPTLGEGQSLVSGPASSRAAFLARAPEGDHYWGLVAPGRELWVYHHPPILQPGEGARLLACGDSSLSAAAIAKSDRVLVASSSGQGFDACAPEETVQEEPNRVQLTTLSFSSGEPHGEAALLFEEVYDEPVRHVAIADAGEEEAWVGWQVGERVRVARVDETGAVQSGPITISETSRETFSMVMRDEELVVASVEEHARGPRQIRFTAVSASGSARALGAFDTAGAPWSSGLSMLASADGSKVFVAYQSTLGRSAHRATARRLDCAP